MPDYINSPVLYMLGILILRNIVDAGIVWMVYTLLVQRNVQLQHKVKHSAALVSLVIIAALFIYSIFTLFQANEFTVFKISPEFIVSNQSLSAIDWFFPMVSITYFLLLGFVLVPFGFQIRKEYKLVQTSFTDQHWQAITNQLAKSMKVGRAVSFALHEKLISPCTTGLWKPIILFPVAVLNQLTPKQIEAVIAHELAHIRRYDYCTNTLVSIIEKLLIINPFAQLLASAIRKEAELSCDAEVIAEDHHPLLYAESLLLLEKSRREGQIGIAFTGSKGMLVERVNFILGKVHQPGLSGRFWLLLPFFLILYSFLYSDSRFQNTNVNDKHVTLKSITARINPSRNPLPTPLLNSEITKHPKSGRKQKLTLNDNRKSPIRQKKSEPLPFRPEVTESENLKQPRADWQADLFVLEKQLPPDPRDRKERSIAFFSEENPLSALIDANIESEIQKAFELAAKARRFKLDPSGGPILNEHDPIHSPEIPPVIFIQTPKELRKRLIPSEHIKVIIHSDGIIEMHE